MANKRAPISDEQRASLGQNVPLGDIGDGQTGVPEDEQGISNRPGDLDDDDDDDDDDEDEGEVSDPEAEPGKPI